MPAFRARVMVLIGVRADDVTEQPQTPEHDCLGDRRLSRAEADFLHAWLVTRAVNGTRIECVEGTTDRALSCIVAYTDIFNNIMRLPCDSTAFL